MTDQKIREVFAANGLRFVSRSGGLTTTGTVAQETLVGIVRQCLPESPVPIDFLKFVTDKSTVVEKAVVDGKKVIQFTQFGANVPLVTFFPPVDKFSLVSDLGNNTTTTTVVPTK